MTLIRLFLTSLLVTSLCACGDSDRQRGGHDGVAGVASAPVRALKIALVLKTLTNPYFVEVEKGARRAAQQFNIDLEVKTGSQETAIEQQIQIVEELIDEKVDAIVITPGDSRRPLPILKQAQHTGILVVVLDDALDADLMARNSMQTVPLVSTDNEASSYRVVKHVTQSIRQATQAGIIGGVPAAQNSQQRMQGAMRAMDENTAIRIVMQDHGNWRIDQGYDAAARILSAHPDVTLIFCANDMMALGTLQYLQESRRRNVTVIGYDAIAEARSAILAGTLAASVDQRAGEQGYQGIALAVRALQGEKPPATTFVKAQVVTAASLR